MYNIKQCSSVREVRWCHSDAIFLLLSVLMLCYYYFISTSNLIDRSRTKNKIISNTHTLISIFYLFVCVRSGSLLTLPPNIDRPKNFNSLNHRKSLELFSKCCLIVHFYNKMQNKAWCTPFRVSRASKKQNENPNRYWNQL